MKPAQRGAETRRRNQAAARAAWLAETLPQRKQECVDAHAEVMKRARAFAALPVQFSQATIDAVHELGHAAGYLWTQLHWLADWTRELHELKGGSPRVKTIHDDLAGVINLAQRRAERSETT